MSSEARLLKDRLDECLSKRSWRGALKACHKLRELNPKDDRVLLRMGEVYERLGKQDKAVHAFKELIELYVNEKRLARAISVAKRITAIDPKDESAQKRLALLYSARGLPIAPMPVRTRRPVSESPAQSPTPMTTTQPKPSFTGLAMNERPSAENMLQESEEQVRRIVQEEEISSIDLGDLDLAGVEMSIVDTIPYPPTPLFSDLAPEELHDVFSLLVRRSYEDNEVIVRQGEKGDSIYIISEGRVRVKVQPLEGSEVELAVMEEGKFFGEFGLFTDGLRHASVIADGSAEALELRMKDLDDIVARYPRVRDVLQHYFRERAVETGLAYSSVFTGLPSDERRQLARLAVQETYPLDYRVLKEGGEGSGLYLVRRGSLAVRVSGLDGKQMEVAKLGPGDFFGEVSLLSGSAVTADVVTVSASDLIKISKEDIENLIKKWPPLKERLESARTLRAEETIERLGMAGVV